MGFKLNKMSFFMEIIIWKFMSERKQKIANVFVFAKFATFYSPSNFPQNILLKLEVFFF